MGVFSFGYPRYYFKQIETPIAINETPVDIISITVETNEDGERVRLGGALSNSIQTNIEGTDFSYTINYQIFRDDTPQTFFRESQRNVAKQANANSLAEFRTPLTWTDIPPSPGIYVYRIVGQIVFPENISQANILSGQLDAIVFSDQNS